MAWITPKTNWQGGDKPTAADFNRIEGNIDVVREQSQLPLKYEVVSSFPAHAVGRVVFHTGNGRAYVSDGTNWIDISGAIGDAIAANVLAGKVFSSQVAGPGVTGTMPNRGAHNITPGTSDITIPNGYHSGAGKVASLGGNAAAGNVLTGKTFSSDVSGRAAAGTMPNRGAVVITPGTANKPITAGYHNGSGYVAGDADLVAEKIKKGVDIFGVAGTFEGAVLPDDSYLYYFGIEGVLWVNGYATGVYTRGKDEYNLRLSSTGSISSNNCAFVTNWAVSLTDINEIIIDHTAAVATGGAYLVVSTSKTGNYNKYDARTTLLSLDRTVAVLDVSALSGDYYVRVHGASTGASTSGKGLLVVHSIRLQ